MLLGTEVIIEVVHFHYGFVSPISLSPLLPCGHLSSRAPNISSHIGHSPIDISIELQLSSSQSIPKRSHPTDNKILSLLSSDCST